MAATGIGVALLTGLLIDQIAKDTKVLRKKEDAIETSLGRKSGSNAPATSFSPHLGDFAK